MAGGRVIQGFFVGRAGPPSPPRGMALPADMRAPYHRAAAHAPAQALATATPTATGRGGASDVRGQIARPPSHVQAARAPKVAQPFGGDDSFAIDPVKVGLLHGGGRPLPGALLAKMEAAFGADFSHVRVHVGPQAARIGALAFTTGSDLYFAPGQFQPDTVRGQQLIGHELAHVVQQRQGRVRAPGAGTSVVHDRALEAEADRLGMRAAGTVLHARVAKPVRPSTIVPRALVQRSVEATVREPNAEEVKKLIRERDDMFTYKGDIVKNNEVLDRGKPLSEWLGHFSENSMIHLTPAARTAFDGGMDADASFARLGDVIDMTVWEFKSKLVNVAAGAFAYNAELAVIWDGKIFEDDEGTFDIGYFEDIFKKHVEGRAFEEYKTIVKIEQKDLNFVQVKDWRTTDKWYLYPHEQ